MKPTTLFLSRIAAILAAASGVFGLSNQATPIPKALDVSFTIRAGSEILNSSFQEGSRGPRQTVVRSSAPITGAACNDRNSLVVNCSAARQSPVISATLSIEQEPADSDRSTNTAVKTHSTSFATIVSRNDTNSSTAYSYEACPIKTLEVPQSLNASGQNTCGHPTLTVATTSTTTATSRVPQTSSTGICGLSETLDLSEKWLALGATILNLISGVALPTFQVALTWRQLAQLNRIASNVGRKTQV
ncbi:hypothetical protein LTR56_013499 [Elasticomyces elasticus]|nr:hypothetical protein LTR56_013499 [Elasticomyces elasticus]KAK3649516.1 hypothetical protein LTR22_012873 [Elasticomyces elasticus]KAK4933038.1 hypothetical protein LTR49_000522 [Elasticomyces elasticus]KAK5763937.1 hypothetical protein LTS12_005847 [Elasticomyces elasticus]